VIGAVAGGVVLLLLLLWLLLRRRRASGGRAPTTVQRSASAAAAVSKPEPPAEQTAPPAEAEAPPVAPEPEPTSSPSSDCDHYWDVAYDRGRLGEDGVWRFPHHCRNCGLELLASDVTDATAQAGVRA
jgi:hypothetical protein